MKRRDFLRTVAMAATTAAVRESECGSGAAGQVMTVRGAISPDSLGPTLPHEHILVDFIGADKIGRDRYDPNEVFMVALPHLKRAYELGIRTLIECTPAYLGRDPLLLRRLSEASGLHILTNTGYYGAGREKFLPAHVFSETIAQLAQRWIGEWQNGIEGTGIRPGFIKIAVDAGVLSSVSRKLVHAAAQTHSATGLTIASHTGNGVAAMEQLDIVAKEGVDASAFVWVHAQNERDGAIHIRAARRGAWLSFDGVAPKTIERHAELVRVIREAGLLGRVLISHDAGWYHVGEPRGGLFRPYDTLFTQFIPVLKKAGFSDEEIQQLTVINPREAFGVRIRKSVEQ